jgi:hypothetical protein
MRRAIDPRHARVEKRLVLARVEMAPRTLLSVIATGRRLLAVGTRPTDLLVLRPEIHALTVVSNATRLMRHSA